MRAHIVYAHPEPKSFCGAMKDTAIDVLTETGLEVILSDRYVEQFNPVASAADFAMRTAACDRTAGAGAGYRPRGPLAQNDLTAQVQQDDGETFR